MIKTFVGDTSGRVDLYIDSTKFDNSSAGFGTTTTGTGFQNVTTGSHSVSELAHDSNTDLGNYASKVVCDSSKGSADPGTSKTFSVAYGDQVTCEITNSRLPQIKVIKTFVGDTSGRVDLYIDSTKFDNSSAGFGTTTTGTGFQNVTTGSHSVSELAHDSNTDLGNYASKVGLRLEQGLGRSGYLEDLQRGLRRPGDLRDHQ